MVIVWVVKEGGCSDCGSSNWRKRITNKFIKFKLPAVVDVFFVHCL